MQSRRDFTRHLLGGLSGAALAAAYPAEAAGIPSRKTIYDFEIEGTTFGGYYPFNREGFLVVQPRIRAAGPNLRNRPNVRDVFLVSGTPPNDPHRGAVWFGTNTAFYRSYGIGSIPNGHAAIDVAYVSMNARARRIDITVDGYYWGLSNARTALMNCFGPTGGLLGQLYQIISGDMVLEFSRDGKYVEGYVDVVGTGYIQPGRVAYQAYLQGTRRGR